MNIFLKRALYSIQFLDELGGPEREEYINVMDALAAECTRRARVAETLMNIYDEEAEVRKAFHELGFRIEHTGGNCTALVCRNPDRTFVVTHRDDAAAPASWADPVVCGLYLEDGWDEGPTCDASEEFDSVSELLTALSDAKLHGGFYGFVGGEQ